MGGWRLQIHADASKSSSVCHARCSSQVGQKKQSPCSLCYFFLRRLSPPPRLPLRLFDVRHCSTPHSPPRSPPASARSRHVRVGSSPPTSRHSTCHSSAASAPVAARVGCGTRTGRRRGLCKVRTPQQAPLASSCARQRGQAPFYVEAGRSCSGVACRGGSGPLPGVPSKILLVSKAPVPAPS